MIHLVSSLFLCADCLSELIISVIHLLNIFQLECYKESLNLFSYTGLLYSY